MSTKELAYSILDSLSEEQLKAFILLFSEKADDAICEKMLNDYFADDDPEKHDSISLEDYAKELGIDL